MNPLSYLTNLIYPAHCIFCDTLLQPDNAYGICETCAADEKTEKYSQTKIVPGVVHAHVCYVYKGKPKETIHRLKFEEKTDYAESIAKIMAKTIENNVNYDILLAIPIGKERARERKYNQSRLIARFLARYIGKESYDDVLIKIRETQKQSELPAKERRKNVIGAFGVINAEKIEGKRILLIDDVCTTGATLSEAAKTLRENGAKSIDACTFAGTEQTEKAAESKQ
jgi:ComF family protein